MKLNSIHRLRGVHESESNHINISFCPSVFRLLLYQQKPFSKTADILFFYL